MLSLVFLTVNCRVLVKNCLRTKPGSLNEGTLNTSTQVFLTDLFDCVLIIFKHNNDIKTKKT